MSKRETFKTKLAIVFGYNGLRFQGSQKNPGAASVETELEKGFYDAELISSDNFDNLKKIGWSRAARTDKGVHAIANYVSCKLAIQKKLLVDESKGDPQPSATSEKTDSKAEGESTKKPEIEEEEKKPELEEEKKKDELEEEGEEDDGEEGTGVAIVDRKTVIINYKAKDKIDKAKMINVINSHLPEDIRVFAIRYVMRKFDAKANAGTRIYEYIAPLSLFHTSKEPVSEEEVTATLKRVGEWVEKFKGTKNYHNYTKSIKFKDSRAKRYIIEMQVDPIKSEKYPTAQFIKFLIHGQSFIYHQIRKMIGVMIQMVHGNEKEDFFEKSFLQDKQKVWIAPPQGLLLNRVTFDGYNKRKEIPEIIEFNEEEEATMAKFKAEKIYPVIYDSELVDKGFSKWLEEVKSNIGGLAESDGEAGEDG